MSRTMRRNDSDDHDDHDNHCECCERVLERLDCIDEKLKEIVMSQSDIDAAVAQDNAAVADLATQDQAIEAAQAELLAEIASLQGQGVNTAALAQASANLATALGANDSTVSALTAAAQPPAPAA